MGKETFTRSVSCYSMKDGEHKWSKEMFNGEQSSIHIDNSPATPTPIIINDTVIAYFGSQGLVCLNTEGVILWENRNLPFEGIHGIGSSPIYHKGFLIVANYQAMDPYLAKIEIETGVEIWRKSSQAWEGIHGEHRSPTVFNYQGQDYIVVWSNGQFIVYDYTDGTLVNQMELAQHSHQMAASILCIDSLLFAPDVRNCYLIDIPSLFNDSLSSVLWKSAMRNKGPKCSSPVFYNNQIFTLSDNGSLSCLDYETGEVINTKRFVGMFMSSLVLINDCLYLSNSHGKTYVVDAKPSLAIVEENVINEGIYASLAVLENRIVIRSTSHLWCVGKN